MKKIIFLILFLLVPSVFAAEKQAIVYDVKFTRLIDGDTIAFQADWLPKPLKPELSIRVYGVDTPEKGFRAKCESEKVRGEAASAFTKAQVKAAKKTQIALMDWDKYGGRVLGDVLLDGKSLRQMLITQGYAREYFGDAKQSWCN